MKAAKDNFSAQSEGYSKFRPVYPTELYQEILNHISTKDMCWDCGTGNGQMAIELASSFDVVEATDISKSQLKKAPRHKNINYSLSRSEKTSFLDNSFDLITVGQAVHWFDHKHFNQEVKRVAKPNAVIALIGYGLMYVNSPFDGLLMEFYERTIGAYWDPERKHIDSHYKTIPFPFETVETSQEFSIDVNWRLEQLEGYLGTWSSVNKYIKTHGSNPVLPFMQKVIEKKAWLPEETKMVRFPLFVKLGRIIK